MKNYLNESLLSLLCFMRGTLGFSVLRFWLFFRSVFRFLCQKTSVFRFWCSLRFADFSFFLLLVFGFRRKYERFFGFVIQCAFWVFLFCPISVPVS